MNRNPEALNPKPHIKETLSGYDLRATSLENLSEEDPADFTLNPKP